MEIWYLQIKSTHIALALCSGGLFALRGLLILLRQNWAMAAPLRYLSYTVDTALLTAALMLLVILRLNPAATPWLALKLCLLVAYIGFGMLAFKSGLCTRSRAFAWVAALTTFGCIYSIARAHSPWGFLAY